MFAPPSAEAWYEIVLPPLMTLAVIVIGALLLWLARRPVAETLRQLGIRRVSALGVDVEFTEERATAAYEKQGLGPPSEADRAALRDAVTHLVPLVAQSHVLWVDDLPSNNLLERSTMLSWEVDVQAVRSTDEALRELEDPGLCFDLIVSDWRRPGDDDDKPAGPELVKALRELGLDPEPSILFYHGFVEPQQLAERRRIARDLRALGATGSPGELFRWCLIELARVALEAPRAEQRERRQRRSPAVALE